MKVAAVRLRPYRLPLRVQWTSAVGGFSLREGWLLCLEADDGCCGYGDCAPLPASGTESLPDAEHALRTHLRSISGVRVDDALAALDTPALARAPAARCAIECALLDLQSQALGLPLRRLLAANAGERIAVNAMLGSLSQATDEAVLAACAQGYSVLKFKAGVLPVDDELARLRDIAARLPAGTRLRLDANRAWHEADAARFVAGCAALPVEMIEEALAAPTVDSLCRVQALCPAPLALDESWPECFPELAAPPTRRLILKPPRVGGLLPAVALARRAEAAGIECIVTGSVESACGVFAAAQLAAALNNGLTHGLATGSWLARDLGKPPEIRQGRLKLPDSIGLGFAPA